MYSAMESSGSEYNDEERALKGLLDAFGSAFTLDEIASAYCKAGRNADLAGEFLYEMQGNASTSTDHPVDGETKGSEQSSASSCANDNVSEQSYEVNGNSRPTNPKNRPVSVGSVSSIIGKDYVRTTRPTNGSCNATKPMKLESKVLPVPELWEEEAKSNSERDDSIRRDMEEFLFRMLGDGFRLERNVIEEVLDACGYDMPKTMEKLLDLSTTALDKKNNFVGDSTNKITGLCSKNDAPSGQKKCTNYCGGNDDAALNSSVELTAKQKQRHDLEREIMASLFNASERETEYELPKKRLTVGKRSGVFGKPVTEPLHDSIVAQKITEVQQQRQNQYDEVEESYKAVRRAVKEYRGMVKEYYQSAVEAFVKGDRARAQKLLEQGMFFHQKAREADEESSEMIFGNRDVEAQDDMLLDLHDHGAKVAIQLLKCRLSSLSGIPSIKHLKVIIETNEEDKSKGSRRRLVLKLLEKESIKWVEDENAGTILIRLDSINRKRLSFVKK
ncbi:putative nuclear RNA export factor SDE5 [Morus notabilis]|nr:putative nuclear RNA export factor SDE5 [Morus notabilis]